MIHSMIRIFLALLVSMSLALPGVAMASSDHRMPVQSEHAGHDHKHATQTDTCETGMCEPTFALMCCDMMAGHCASAGVPADTNWAPVSDLFSRGGYLTTEGSLLKSQSFEADPPPPRT